MLGMNPPWANRSNCTHLSSQYSFQSRYFIIIAITSSCCDRPIPQSGLELQNLTSEFELLTEHASSNSLRKYWISNSTTTKSLSVEIACTFQRRDAFQVRWLYCSNKILRYGKPGIANHAYTAIAPWLRGVVFETIICHARQ